MAFAKLIPVLYSPVHVEMPWPLAHAHPILAGVIVGLALLGGVFCALIGFGQSRLALVFLVMSVAFTQFAVRAIIALGLR